MKLHPTCAWSSDAFRLFSPITSFIQSIASILPMFLILAFMDNVCMIIKGLVLEKELRLKEVLRAVGVHNSALWFSRFTENFVLLTVPCALISVMVKVSRKETLNQKHRNTKHAISRESRCLFWNWGCMNEIIFNFTALISLQISAGSDEEKINVAYAVTGCLSQRIIYALCFGSLAVVNQNQLPCIESNHDRWFSKLALSC